MLIGVTHRLRPVAYPALAKMLLIWVFTVAAPMCSRRAISWLESPSATRDSTSVSRAVSPSGAASRSVTAGTALTRSSSRRWTPGASPASPAITSWTALTISSPPASFVR